MSGHRRRLNRETAERLLRGDAAAPDHDRLTGMLHAAAAPARADELAREDAVMVAYRDAHLDARSPRTQRGSMIKTTLAKLVTVKVAAVIAATTAGGIAVASATGNLPTQDNRPSHEAPAGPSDHPTGKPGDLPTSDRGNGQGKGAENGGNGTPSPSLDGLCRAYTANVHTDPGKALDSPAFTVLIDAAGGEDKVADFCAARLDDANSDNGTGRGEPSTHPTGKPTNPGEPGDDHSGGTGGGTDRPTPGPTDRPTPDNG